MAKLIVTGGAGYIGSHTAFALRRAGHEVVIVDDLSNGHADSVRRFKLYQLDVTVPGVIEKIAVTEQIQGIYHFAARIEVGESVKRPDLYYATNVGGTLQICLTAAKLKIPVIFSSTAAVYGEPTTMPIPIDHACRPANPYGSSKLISEQVLVECTEALGFGYAILRYFNAAGANIEANLRERHKPETHLIPLAIDAALGKRPSFSLFGQDWPTIDGTCVRDFVHVMDLAEAHVRAFEYLVRGGTSAIFNIGAGQGITVQQVIDTIERITGNSINVTRSARRPGDVAMLVADITETVRVLDWKPKRSDIELIVKDVHRAQMSSM